jgi:hypothetical protein
MAEGGGIVVGGEVKEEVPVRVTEEEEEGLLAASDELRRSVRCKGEKRDNLSSSG